MLPQRGCNLNLLQQMADKSQLVNTSQKTYIIRERKIISVSEKTFRLDK